MRTQQKSILWLVVALVILIAIFLAVRTDDSGTSITSPPGNQNRTIDLSHGIQQLDVPAAFRKSDSSGINPQIVAWYRNQENGQQFGYSATQSDEQQIFTKERVENEILPELQSAIPDFSLKEVVEYQVGTQSSAGATYQFKAEDQTLEARQVYVGRLPKRFYTFFFISLPEDDTADTVFRAILDSLQFAEA